MRNDTDQRTAEIAPAPEPSRPLDDDVLLTDAEVSVMLGNRPAQRPAVPGVIGTADCSRTVSNRVTPAAANATATCTITFRLARPGGHWGRGTNAGKLSPSAPTHPRGKLDIDKLARSTLDSLTGIMFDDDSRIVALRIAKVYAAPGQEGATIEVAAMRAGEAMAGELAS